MPHGTLANLATSAFVRTPPTLAERIVRCLLAFPQDKTTNVLDPTAGEGDLLFPCREIPQARLYGVEISAERTAIARDRLPQAELVTCAFEGVSIPKGSMSLVLANPPYFFQDGKRAEYRILADAGTLLMPSGVMVAILPARSAWDGTMINHWCRWYDLVRIWKFPDRASQEEEGAFEDYTQICVVGIRRAEPRDPLPAESRRLQGYRYHAPSVSASGRSPSRVRAGWEQGTPPPKLPTLPISDSYPVPESLARPHIVVRHADESVLLASLERCGAHLSPSFQAATEWREESLRASPVMPLSGEAHVAAEVLTGLLDGEIVWGPQVSGDRREGATQVAPHLLTAFVGQEWVSMPVDTEEREKLRERGVVRVAMRQWQDKPILGVLNLATGETRYEQGEAVFTFLQPWLSTLASRVVEKRQPLYRLDPADWELRVVAQFGRDKQLPNAAFPGLSLAQQHRVYAMGRALDASGRSAIQGEPGTGKTRLAVATAARQAYSWRHRNTPLFRDGRAQPAWVSGLRRAWLKNPRTLALLGLTPVRDTASEQVIAYRRKDGSLLPPEEAGPQALPVLVSTPKKVTKEYAAEVRAAWPEAEVVFLERHGDIPKWMQRCAESHAPAVIAILSHSLTRAFGREWQPVVREKQITRREPVMEPEKELLPQLEPVYDGGRVLTGYRWRESRELYTQEVTISRFYCPDCGDLIRATPGRLHEREQRTDQEESPLAALKKGQQEEEDVAESESIEPVTSCTWFTLKPRWCSCRADAWNRPGPRNPAGRARVRTPLWTDARIAVTQRKHPQLPFAAWSAAMEHMSRPGNVGQRSVAETAVAYASPVRSAPAAGKCKVAISSGLSLTSHHGQSAQRDEEPCYVAREPLPDSFSPYDYLYRFYRGCVALAVQEWAMPRHLASHYGRLVRSLDDLARRRNTAARLAKGTVPRWFAVLPCDRPFEVWETRRDRWGDTQGRALLVETERLEFEYLYPLERRLIALVQKELSEKRRVMVYFEQNDLRSMARRLEWVLKEALQAQRLQPWTLPNSVAAEDRQQAILQAVQRGHRVVIVPYRRVNEGLNLQSGIDSIIWVEMALNLFMLDQASRRAWRLGKREEVRIYYLAYANTAGHTKLRKLGQQSGAAAAFAGEPARGALIEHAGADKTTLARLSSLLEQSEGEGDDEEEDVQVLLTGESEVAEEEAALKAVFARRAEELRKALVRGREWLGGMQDDLADRFAALATSPAAASVWAARPHPLVPSIRGARKAVQMEAGQQRDHSQLEPVISLPAVTTPVFPGAALSPVLPAEMATTTPAVAPTAEPALVLLVGSRAEVVFGRNEHIALVRVRSRARRTRGYGEPLRRRVPVSEREIPSLTEGESVGEEERSQQVAMPSLWDLLVAPTSRASAATPVRLTLSPDPRPAPHQSHLWE